MIGNSPLRVFVVQPRAGRTRMERMMQTLLASIQLVAAAGLILIAVVLSWRAGDKFWSSRSSR